MTTLRIDIETYSDVSIRKSGLYKYADSPAFEILLFSYKVNNQPTECVDLASGEELPAQILFMLFDDTVIKKAWNAAFEFYCIQKYLDSRYCDACMQLDMQQWRCTMVKAAYNALPLALDMAGSILRIEKEKFTTGKGLIPFFCSPCKPTKRNGMRTRNFHYHDPIKWKEFKKYNIRDVDAEKAIDDKLLYDLPPFEQKLYFLDQEINRYGVQCDKKLISEIMRIDSFYQSHLINSARDITNLPNPKSVKQLVKWLKSEIGIEDEHNVQSLNKKGVENLLDFVDDLAVKEVLYIRKELALSSIKKYATMHNTMNAEGIIRGLFQFYGANRTGRWAGRMVQVHNLARQKYKLTALRQFREYIKGGCDFELLALFESKGVAHLFKELCRTAFAPRPGKKFIIADYSAIEARIIAWLAGEKWKLEVFKTHGKIYEATASRMFNVPFESITETSEERFKGKVSELALGYQGGVNALIKMGAIEMGMKEEELPQIVRLWRKANPEIVKLWYHAQDAFYAALEAPGTKIPFCKGLLSIRFNKGSLELTLPSGRILFYRNAKVMQGPKGNVITYQGVNQTTKKWCLLQIYGGKIIENVVQAMARDLLAGAMLNIQSKKNKIVMHIHDEIVAEVDKHNTLALEIISRRMTRLPAWAKGLPLDVKGFEADFYRKN